MASYKDLQDNIIVVTDNILISLDETSTHGDMYVYDDKYRYILNGMTAYPLIEHFYNQKGKVHLSEEIQDTMMSLTLYEETH